MKLASFVQSFRRAPPRPGASDGRLRVIIELASFDKGGLEKVVLDFALAFDRARIEVTIVTPGTLGHLARRAEQAGIRVVGLPGPNVKLYERELDRLSPDLAISHFSELGYRLFKRRGIPNITFIHNVYAFLGDKARREFRANDRFVDRYISVSKKATRYAVSNLGVSGDKVVTIPNGLIIAEHEMRERRPVALTRQELGLGDRDYVFVNVASYNLHKGHYLMADAMRRVLQRRSDIKILCVGNVIVPQHAEALRGYLREQGLADHILLPGYYENVEDPLRIADAFLLPSFIEGWSIAMNEAMFYGKPMILSDIGGAAEVIDNSDIGLLLPTEYEDFTKLDSRMLDALTYTPHSYRTAPLLADAMMDFANDPLRWKAAGLRGRDKIYRHYDFPMIIRQYEDVIREVVAGEPGRPRMKAASVV